MNWYKINLSSIELKEIENKEKNIKKIQLLKRLQVIKLKSQQWKNKDLSKFIWVSINTITNWIKAYKEGGIEQLLNWEYKWKESLLTKAQISELKEKNKEKPFSAAKEVKQYIEKHFNLNFHLHWVQKLLKKNFDCHTKKQL